MKHNKNHEFPATSTLFVAPWDKGEKLLSTHHITQCMSRGKRENKLHSQVSIPPHAMRHTLLPGCTPSHWQEPAQQHQCTVSHSPLIADLLWISGHRTHDGTASLECHRNWCNLSSLPPATWNMRGRNTIVYNTTIKMDIFKENSLVLDCRNQYTCHKTEWDKAFNTITQNKI